MARTIIDIHVLQTVPPSNLNRDDTGSPKTAYYGGVRRSRVSSQAWKRACREMFESHLDESELGVRTKRVVELLSARIAHKAPELSERSEQVAQDTLEEIGIKTKKPKKSKDADGDPAAESDYLIFLSAQQYDNIADAAIDAATEADSFTNGLKAKKIKTLALGGQSLDLALFGRMVADAPELNIDASAQVAHAISVHPVANEYDYYTAVDDQKKRGDEAGAAMIGTIEFNSATLYRYATVDVDQLNRNLGNADATRRATEAFVRSFVRSMPTGKQNTFAGHTRPDLVLVKARDTQPMSFVGAFEGAVVAQDGSGRVEKACAKLAEHVRCVEDNYEEHALRSWVVPATTAVDGESDLGEPASLPQLVDQVGDVVAERLAAH